jgi:hypothetical protein
LEWLFKVEERDNDEERIRDLERLDTIRDIRRRIEKLRKELSSPRPTVTQRNEQVLEQAPRVERTREEQERKNAEMNDLKAKLLGRKK